MQVIGKRHRPLAAIHRKVLTSCRGNLCLLDTPGGKADILCPLPMGKMKRLLAHVRLLERLLRLEAKAAILLDEDNVLLSCDGHIYRVHLPDGTMVQEHTYRNGMRNPLYFTAVTGVPGFRDSIAYGEYTLNPQRRNPSSIFTREKESGIWTPAYTFEPGRIRHIHGLVPDRERECVYVLTGDGDGESGIWEARHDFREMKPLLCGSQRYRSGFLFRTAAGWLYPTDTAMEQNYIYQLHENPDGWTVEPLSTMTGSCVSAGETARTVLISTTVEADERVTGWKSWLNLRRGPGIQSTAAQLLAVDKETHRIRTIAAFEKDFWPYKLFQYGCIKILDVPEREQVLLYPMAVRGYDGRLLCLDYREIEGCIRVGGK